MKFVTGVFGENALPIDFDAKPIVKWQNYRHFKFHKREVSHFSNYGKYNYGIEAFYVLFIFLILALLHPKSKNRKFLLHKNPIKY